MELALELEVGVFTMNFKKNKSKIIWISIFFISLLIGLTLGAIIIDNQDAYEKEQSNKLTFTETTKPEDYDFAFQTGNRIVGINIDSSSDLWYKDDKGNNIGLNKYALEWTMLYDSYTTIRKQQLQIEELQTTINLLCSVSLLC